MVASCHARLGSGIDEFSGDGIKENTVVDRAGDDPLAGGLSKIQRKLQAGRHFSTWIKDRIGTHSKPDVDFLKIFDSPNRGNQKTARWRQTFSGWEYRGELIQIKRAHHLIINSGLLPDLRALVDQFRGYQAAIISTSKDSDTTVPQIFPPLRRGANVLSVPTMAMTPDGSRVYIANEGSDIVSVIDTDSAEMIERYRFMHL